MESGRGAASANAKYQQVPLKPKRRPTDRRPATDDRDRRASRPTNRRTDGRTDRDETHESAQSCRLLAHLIFSRRPRPIPEAGRKEGAYVRSSTRARLSQRRAADDADTAAAAHSLTRARTSERSNNGRKVHEVPTPPSPVRPLD